MKLIDINKCNFRMNK